MMNAGQRLREARKAVGFLSAAEAAKAIGVPIATYTGHEANHRGFPAKKAALYAKHFHVSVNWLLFGEKPTQDTALVPIIAVIENGQSQINELSGSACTTTSAPSGFSGVKYAFQIAHDAMHMFAGWTFFLEEKTDRLSKIAEDKLCLVGLSNGHILLAKPRRASANGLYHLYFFGETPRTDVKIKWISRVIATRL